MARDIITIYNTMIAEKETKATLIELQPDMDSAQQFFLDLASTSKVADWRLMFFLFANSVQTMEELFDLHKEWIEARAAEIQTGTLPWYRQLCLDFQYGDTLVFLDGKYKYETIDPAAQIVKLATANESGGTVILKVAKLDGSNNPVELSPTELSALQLYIKKMKFAGVKVSTVSRPADLIKVHYKVYYDPLLLSSTGELLTTPGVFPVRDAINNYCKNLPFDGVYSITEQTDRIQQAIGVVNPVHQSTEVKFGLNPYTTFTDYYNPNAGYLTVDPLYPLSSTITYIVAP